MKVSILSSLLVLGIAAAPRAEAQSFRGEARVGVRIPVPTFRVRVAPPVLRSEVRVRAPSPRHVWAPGYWGWNRDRHAWVAGRWLLPPRPHAIYVSPRWVSAAGAWSFYPGYWQDTDQAYDTGDNQYDDLGQTVPAQYEYIPVPPSPGHYWVRGDWYGRGYGRQWRPGRWEARRDYRHDWRRDDHHGRWGREYSRRN
jgi:hypothetical protein